MGRRRPGGGGRRSEDDGLPGGGVLCRGAGAGLRQGKGGGAGPHLLIPAVTDVLVKPPHPVQVPVSVRRRRWAAAAAAAGPRVALVSRLPPIIVQQRFW